MTADDVDIHGRFRLHQGDFVLDAELRLPGRGVHCVFGRSGCGKTTLLRCLAGLERPDPGHLRVNGQVWQSADRRVFVPPHRRSVGVVFQDTRLFPHLSVRQNLMYGLRRTPTDRRRIEPETVIEALGIHHLLSRRPVTLSGGEAKRVAVGRALLSSPDFLLLDEPLAGIDVGARHEIIGFLKALHRTFDLPIVYVSHDLDEITRLSDTMTTLENGRVTGHGTMAEVLATIDPTLGDSLLAVVVEGKVCGYDDSFAMVELDINGSERMTIPGPRQAVGAWQAIRIAARDVGIGLHPPTETAAIAVLPATVKAVTDGNHPLMTVTLDTGGAVLLAVISRPAAARLGLAVGSPVYAEIRHADLMAGTVPDRTTTISARSDSG